MKEDLQKKLVDIAPYMFRYEGWNDLQQSLMGFGFEVGDGWYGILEDLITKIKNMDADKAVKVIQIKEKFGSLRVYVEAGWDELYGLIDAAEAKSYKTCEHCGSTDGVTQNKTGWVQTLCSKCKKSPE